MKCIKCGAESVGQYCNNCAFYENNAQCWRCRMYLPRVELQQWRGQTYCPYCIMDIREMEKKAEEYDGEQARHRITTHDTGSTPPDERPFGTGQQDSVYECDKCKNDLDIVYVIADHKFCELCFNQQMREWKNEGVKPPPYLKYKLKESVGFFAKLILLLKHKITQEWEKRMKKKDK